MEKKRSQNFAAKGVWFFSDQVDCKIAAVNNELENAAGPGFATENQLMEYFTQIEETMHPSEPGYWLLLARLNEAALLTAGNYADNAEFKLAGDLLLNPRRIDIYFKGNTCAFVKNRHGRLSEQFNTSLKPDSDFKKWFSRNAVVHHAQPALLTYLIKRLQTSGCISEVYIEACRTRMVKITETMVFLMAWGIDCFELLSEKRACSDNHTLQFLNENMCRFAADWFIHIGDRISIYLERREQIQGTLV